MSYSMPGAETVMERLAVLPAMVFSALRNPAILIGPIATTIIGDNVWAANQNRAFSGVMDPTAGHVDWNAFQPLRHALTIRIDEKFKVAREAVIAFVVAFRREVSDPRRMQGPKSEGLSAIAQQEMPGRRRQSHPLINGYNEPQVIN